MTRYFYLLGNFKDLEANSQEPETKASHVLYYTTARSPHPHSSIQLQAVKILAATWNPPAATGYSTTHVALVIQPLWFLCCPVGQGTGAAGTFAVFAFAIYVISCLNFLKDWAFFVCLFFKIYFY